jgi:predicted GNAT family acetyltransferase
MIRKYQNKDYIEVFDMLITEGIPECDMRFREYDTYVIERDGVIRAFFTFKHEPGCLSVQHFCVSRSYRSAGMARELVKAMVKTANLQGVAELILHSKRNLTDTFIQYYFKTKPYAIEGITTFYCVSLKGG